MEQSNDNIVPFPKNRVFVKLYVDAVHSGLLADIGAERWQTLTVLASFMDEKGECYPSQSLIGAKLGITRENANRRIKRLAEYRYKGKPVIETKKVKSSKSNGWTNTVYRILPTAKMAIFNGKNEGM